MKIQALRNHRWARLVVVLALGALVGAVPLRAADRAAPAPLTEEERSRLEKQALDLNERGVLLYQQGRYAEATKLLEQALEMRQRLYPNEQYPQGHPDLAVSLANLAS